MSDAGAYDNTSKEDSAKRAPFSPKQFLKRQRPERFSDTVASDVPALDRTLLEYHLETLTSRSEELLFEDFAKSLLDFLAFRSSPSIPDCPTSASNL